MELRPYQIDAVSAVRDAMAEHRRVLLVSPTGSGKTACFSYIARGAQHKNKRVLILAHRRELIKQICTALDSWDVPHATIDAGSKHVPRANVIVGNVFTVVRRLDKIAPPDLLIQDEAHHFSDKNTFSRIAAAFPNARLLGVTATPVRADSQPLRGAFDSLVLGPSVAELTALGFLSPVEVYAPAKPDLSGVHSRMGDYVTAELAAAMDKPKLTGSAVKHYQKLCPNARALAFCVSVAHAKSVADEFNAAGIPAASVDGKMYEPLRDDVLNGLREGRIQVVTSCDLISEGFDAPAVECAILLRPTQSLGLYLQQVGRAIRISPGKTITTILDHSNSTATHGFIDEERMWSLDGIAERKKSGDKPPAVRTCPECLAPETRILYADMVWRPIGQARVGDKILAFDEHDCGEQSFARRLRETEIKSVWRRRGPSVKISAAGREIICSPNHKWLVRRHNRKWPQDNWRSADDIGMRERLLEIIPPRSFVESDDFQRGYICGMTKGDGTFRYIPENKGKPWRGRKPNYWRVAIQETDIAILKRLKNYFWYRGVYLVVKEYWRPRGAPLHHANMLKVEARSWPEMEIIASIINDERDTHDFMRGYISGFYDAEGSHSGTVRMCQKDVAVLDKIKAYADILGLPLLMEPKCASKSAVTLRLVGRPRIARSRRRNGVVEKLNFFTCITPALLRKIKADGAPFNPERIKIDSILPHEEMELVDIETGTGTFIAEGFATHNCFAAHRPAPICPRCQFVYPIQSRQVDQVDGNLTLVTDPKRIKMDELLAEPARAKEYEFMLRMARKKGYKDAWAWHVVAAKEAKRRMKRLSSGGGVS